MTTRKPTKRDRFNALLAIPAVSADADLVEFINHEPTPKQVENAGFKADILAFCEPDTLYNAGDIAKGVPSIAAAGLSVQRVSAMLTQLVNDGSLVKTEDKRKSFYSLA